MRTFERVCILFYFNSLSLTWIPRAQKTPSCTHAVSKKRIRFQFRTRVSQNMHSIISQSTRPIVSKNALPMSNGNGAKTNAHNYLLDGSAQRLALEQVPGRLRAQRYELPKPREEVYCVQEKIWLKKGSKWCGWNDDEAWMITSKDWYFIQNTRKGRTSSTEVSASSVWGIAGKTILEHAFEGQ